MTSLTKEYLKTRKFAGYKYEFSDGYDTHTFTKKFAGGTRVLHLRTGTLLSDSDELLSVIYRG